MIVSGNQTSVASPLTLRPRPTDNLFGLLVVGDLSGGGRDDSARRGGGDCGRVGRDDSARGGRGDSGRVGRDFFALDRVHGGVEMKLIIGSPSEFTRWLCGEIVVWVSLFSASAANFLARDMGILFLG